jgi:DNA-binding HxlR family transcriptional regulator
MLWRYYAFSKALYSVWDVRIHGGEPMIVKKDLPACPVATTVGLIGNKWKILILRDVLDGTKRFGELRKSLEGISQKVLTDNLRAMEKDGLLVRTVFPEVPPHVEYSLSELGETMRPIIRHMEEWGRGYKEMAGKDMAMASDMGPDNAR